MLTVTSDLVKQYVELLSKIYGEHLKTVILYGSYARGDYTENSDIDIMVLLDLSDMDIKKYRHELSGMTYDFNMDYDLDIKPIVKNKEHFNKWVDVYPFYTNIDCLTQHNEKGSQRDLVLYRIETAKSDVKSAKILLEAGEYRGANNRAYYGIYHTISAIHALDGNAYKRHKDALANFNKNYIKTEIFPRTLGRRIA